MKRRDLVRQLEAAGCEFVRHGRRHDLYRNPVTGAQTAVPRHREVAETLCEAIRKQLGVSETPPATGTVEDEDEPDSDN